MVVDYQIVLLIRLLLQLNSYQKITEKLGLSIAKITEKLGKIFQIIRLSLNLMLQNKLLKNIQLISGK